MSAEPSELLLSYLPLIERVIAFTAQKHGLTAVEAEDFASIVKVRLIENECAIVRAYEGRSKPATYFSMVIQRMLFDHRNKGWGKWRTSAEAKRLGPVAVELERYLYRDELTLDEVFALLKNKDDSLTREAVEALAKRLPPRAPKRHDVPLDEADGTAGMGSEQIESDATSGERRALAKRLSAIGNEWMSSLSDEDCVLLQQRFGDGMTVKQLACALRVEQKPLYRRFERLLDALGKPIESAGITADQVRDLIGRNDTVLDFLLRKPAPRPSKDRPGETTAADSEEP